MKPSSLPNLHPSLYPILFVLLWSTGFIGARLGLPYADPYSFLSIRLLAASLLMAVIAWLWRAKWPRGHDLGHSLVSGLLIHLGYLGESLRVSGWAAHLPSEPWWLDYNPCSPGIFAALFLGEKITRSLVFALLLGLAGVVIVLSDHLSFQNYNHYSLIAIVFALFSITFGTIYQKRFFGQTDIRTGSAVQYFLCGILLALPSLLALVWPGHGIPSVVDIVWTGEFWLALIWLTLVLSVVSIALLFWLIRHYSAARVSSLMYLVPPTTAILAWLIFGDPISWRIVFGMALVIIALVWSERERRL